MKLAMGHYINICMIEITEPHHIAIKICVLYRSYQIKLQLLFFECQIAKVYMPKLKLEGMFYQIILQAR